MGDPTVEDLLEQLAMMTAGLQPLIQAQEAALSIAQAPLNNLREEIVTSVLELGHTVDTVYARATYRKPSTRTSWDNKALDGYAAAHEEILQFRKESSVKPSVAIKLV